MTEYSVSHQVLKELYHEIYQLHWSYLELEDGLQKLEEQKLLEGLLKKFLCVVPHNRKFFLPETFAVFKRTVTQMKDFSVVKMLNGFESISQYANNLFTKPWRKEYRTIKMYSGFFIHEIKSNLVEPEELFLAMGYKKSPTAHELVLDGEICPDQVMNMSRDAMTAYTECKIMNRIYSELTTTYKISCSWQDVFNYREQYTGGVTETIEAIKNLIQHHNISSSAGICVPREKQLSTPCYIQPQQSSSHLSSSASAMGQPQCIAAAPCPSDYNHHHHQAIPVCAAAAQRQLPPHHHYEQPQLLMNPSPAVAAAPAPCELGYYAMGNGTGGQTTLPLCAHQSTACGAIIPPSVAYSSQLRANSHQQSAMYHPHTPICDYGPTVAPQGPQGLPHSKSMDHYSYPTVLGDVMGHRHGSLDHNHHHGAFAATTGTIPGASRSHGNVNGIGTIAGGGGGYYEPIQAAQAAAYNVSGTRYPLPYSISAQFGGGVLNNEGGIGGGVGYYDHRQHFDHSNPQTTATNLMANHHRCDNGNAIGDSYGGMVVTGNGAQQHQQVEKVPRTQFYSQLMKTNDQMAPPMNESSDELDRYGAVRRLRDAHHHHQQQTPRSSDFDSYEELFGEKERERKSGRTGRSTDKIQDGVGSFESWDYVYQSLDQQEGARKAVQQQHPPPPPAMMGNGKVLTAMGSKEAAATVSKTKTMSRQEASKIQEQISSLRAVKPREMVDDVGEPRRERRSTGGNHQKSNSIGGTEANGRNGSLLVPNGNHQRQASDSGLNGKSLTGTGRSNGQVTRGKVTANEDSSYKDTLPPPLLIPPDEWSCRHCTFLNKNSRRICEICAKSKDFNLEGTGNGSATCV